MLRHLRTACARFTPSSSPTVFLLATATATATATAFYCTRQNNNNLFAHAEPAKVQPDVKPTASKLTPVLKGLDRSARDAKLSPTEDAPMRVRMANFVKEIQAEIVQGLEETDGKKFLVEQWLRPEGGEGISCVLQDGNVFQKAGVMVSVVYGSLPEAAVRQMRNERHKDLEGDGPYPFFAAGISLVVHPKNPFAPTVHLNYRYFEIENEDGSPKLSWFGGGTDLTPAYLFEEDAQHFHQTLKEVCNKHDPRYYPDFKKWCDEYFYIPHRKETRGVGGIFYDDLDDKSPEELFAFAKDAAKSFLPSYLPIVNRRKDMAYTEEQFNWQQLRRGRYAEFNLIYDRGTKFGLMTPGARIESILVSLPLTARWEYCHSPEAGSAEAKLVQVLQKPREWVA